MKNIYNCPKCPPELRTTRSDDKIWSDETKRKITCQFCGEVLAKIYNACDSFDMLSDADTFIFSAIEEEWFPKPIKKNKPTIEKIESDQKELVDKLLKDLFPDD